MLLKEAKEILEKNGYSLKESMRKGTNLVVFKSTAAEDLKRYFRKFPEIKIVEQKSDKEIVLYFEGKGLWNNIKDLLEDLENADSLEYITQIDVDFN